MIEQDIDRKTRVRDDTECSMIKEIVGGKRAVTCAVSTGTDVLGGGLIVLSGGGSDVVPRGGIKGDGIANSDKDSYEVSFKKNQKTKRGGGNNWSEDLNSKHRRKGNRNKGKAFKMEAKSKRQKDYRNDEFFLNGKSKSKIRRGRRISFDDDDFNLIRK